MCVFSSFISDCKKAADDARNEVTEEIKNKCEQCRPRYIENSDIHAEEHRIEIPEKVPEKVPGKVPGKVPDEARDEAKVQFDDAKHDMEFDDAKHDMEFYDAKHDMESDDGKTSTDCRVVESDSVEIHASKPRKNVDHFDIILYEDHLKAVFIHLCHVVCINFFFFFFFFFVVYTCI